MSFPAMGWMGHFLHVGSMQGSMNKAIVVVVFSSVYQLAHKPQWQQLAADWPAWLAPLVQVRDMGGHRTDQFPFYLGPCLHAAKGQLGPGLLEEDACMHGGQGSQVFVLVFPRVPKKRYLTDGTIGKIFPTYSAVISILWNRFRPP